MDSTYFRARIPLTEPLTEPKAAESERELQSSVLAKRPRYEFEYDNHLLIRRYGQHDQNDDRLLIKRYGQHDQNDDYLLIKRNGRQDHGLSSTPGYVKGSCEDNSDLRVGERGTTNPDGVQSLRETREQYAPLAPYNYDDYRSELPIRGSGNVDVAADAASTLFVDGIPSDCSRREAAHIFRHFRGYKEMRLVSKSKEAANQGEGEASVNAILCFVDFENPKCAAAAMEALQGYRFDNDDRDSPSLKLRSAYPQRNRSRNGSNYRFARRSNRGRGRGEEGEYRTQ